MLIIIFINTGPIHPKSAIIWESIAILHLVCDGAMGVHAIRADLGHEKDEYCQRRARSASGVNFVTYL